MHVATHQSVHLEGSLARTSPSGDGGWSRLKASDDGGRNGRAGAVFFPLSGSALLTQRFPALQVPHSSLPTLSSAGTRQRIRDSRAGNPRAQGVRRLSGHTELPGR